MSNQTNPRVGVNIEGHTIIHRNANINIILDGGDDQVYATHDIISGRVVVEHDNDAVVTELSLTLEGATATDVSNASNTGPATGRTKGRHHFLKLQHPVDTSLVSARALEDGRTQIQIPFTFVVPEKMLSGACSHKIRHPDVKAAHLLLPPTLEDEHYAIGAQVAKISYAIRALSSLQIISTGASQNESRSLAIRISPVRAEEPPLGLYDDQQEYCLRRTVPIKSTFRKTLGELTAETTQPPCVRLPDQTIQEGTISTLVRFTFAPAKQDELPPEITAITMKLLEYTFFAATRFENLPRPTKGYDKGMLHRSYIEDFMLPSHRLSKTEWEKHDGKYYTASISVPILIPQVHSTKGLKKFPPSFHTCLVSRTHAVELEIRVKTTSIVLTTPIQLVAKATRRAPEHVSAQLPTTTLVETDEVISPGAAETPSYEEMTSQPTTREDAFNRSPQPDELPNYASDPDPTAGQTRQSVSTTYEVPEQEWQNVWTGAKWVYKKAKSVQQRRSSRSDL